MLHKLFKIESQTLQEMIKHSENLRTEWKLQGKFKRFSVLLENTI